MFLAVASSRPRLSANCLDSIYEQTGEQHSFIATASQAKKDIECVIFYDPVTKVSTPFQP